jgi:transposase-like protein
VEDKRRILEDVDRATGHGGIGAVLRREGIYSSTLHAWRKDRDAASRALRSQTAPTTGAFGGKNSLNFHTGYPIFI